MRHQVNWKDRCTNRNQKELKLQGLSLFLEKPLFVIDFWWISTALKTAIFAPEGAIDSCSLIICSVTKFLSFYWNTEFLIDWCIEWDIYETMQHDIWRWTFL